MTAATGMTVGGKPVPGHPARAHAVGAERKAVLDDLVRLTGWLKDHLEAPLPSTGHEVRYTPRDGVNGVRRIAAAIGVKAEDCPALVRATVRIGSASYVVWAPRSLGGEQR